MNKLVEWGITVLNKGIYASSEFLLESSINPIENHSHSLNKPFDIRYNNEIIRVRPFVL